MAAIPETPQFDAEIYLIETTDKVLGGADGKINLQAGALANRTAYLKQEVEAAGTVAVSAEAKADSALLQVAAAEEAMGSAAASAASALQYKSDALAAKALSEQARSDAQAAAATAASAATGAAADRITAGQRAAEAQASATAAVNAASFVQGDRLAAQTARNEAVAASEAAALSETAAAGSASAADADRIAAETARTGAEAARDALTLDLPSSTDALKGAGQVGYGEGLDYAAGTVGAAIQERLPEIGTYALLRAYAGPVTSFLVRGVEHIFDGGHGVFLVDAADTTSADNGGTILVDASGRRWKREYEGKVSVKWFGAKGDGATDDAAAFGLALDYAIANKAQVHAPSGRYVIGSKISKTLATYYSLSISGDGENASIIMLNTGGDGLEFTMPSNYWLEAAPGNGGLHFSDLTFSTTNTNVGIGVNIIGASVSGRPGPKVSFSNVEFRAKNSFSQFWLTGLQITDCQDVWLTDCRFIIGGPTNAVSTGVKVSGTAQANSPTSLFVDNCEFLYGDAQLSVGDYVEGVYVTQPSMVGGLVGIQYKPVIGESGLHLIGGHISASKNCVELNNLFDFEIIGVLFYRAGTTANFSAIKTDNGGRFTISGNVFKGANTTGDNETAILVSSSINDEKYGSFIGNNTFHSFGGRAVWLSANANYVHVGDNVYRQCNSRVLNQSTNSNVSFAPKVYARNFAQAITGGASTENLDVPLPAGMFRVKPGAAFLQADSGSILSVTGVYDATNSNESNARFVLRNPAGGNITGNTYRFSIACFEATHLNSF